VEFVKRVPVQKQVLRRHRDLSDWSLGASEAGRNILYEISGTESERKDDFRWLN